MKLENGIKWADATGNPVIGCRGCELGERCYALNDTPARVHRANGVETFRPGSVRIPVKGFASKVRKLNKMCVCDTCRKAKPFIYLHSVCAEREGDDDPKCGGTYRRIRFFADSNSDWLDWPIGVLASALDAIRQAPNLNVILCTKWPELFFERIGRAAAVAHKSGNFMLQAFITGWALRLDPPPNIWLLTSITTQKTLKRAVDLLKIPAAVHGLSCEPLWENVKLDGLLGEKEISSYSAFNSKTTFSGGISWVIVGGESGNNRKDCGVDAIESVVEQCVSVGVKVYCKQDCAAKPGQQGRISESAWSRKEFPR